MVPDRPPPKPLNVSFRKSSALQGKNVNKHTYDTLDSGVKIGMRVYKVLMGS